MPQRCRRRLGVALTLGLGLWASAQAAMVYQPVPYERDGRAYEGVLVYDDSVATQRPALLMAPNWTGVNQQTLDKAAVVAGRDYVVLVADLYGKDVRPQNGQEAAAAASPLRQDRTELRARMQKALAVLRAQAETVPIDLSRVAAIGFCFGGTAALELARDGADLPAVVAFHAGLSAPIPAQQGQLKASVLVLNGADDPAVPAEEVQAFEAEMRAAKADWALVNYGNAVHSFTNPQANNPGRAEYNPVVAARSFDAMRRWLSDAWPK